MVPTPPPFTPLRFLHRVAFALALVLVPSITHAVTYFVAPTGSDSNSGVTAGAPFATIGKANGKVQPGDVVIIADGTYSQFPNPAVSGTATGRITYIGDLATPANVSVSGNGTIIKDYVTVKGFHFTGGVYITGTRDSVAWCRATGTGSRMQKCTDSVMAFCVINAQRFWFQGTENDTTFIAKRDTITDCVFNLTPVDPTGHTIRMKTLTDCLVRRSRFNINIQASAYDASPTKMFWVRSCRFVDTSWDITNNCTSGCDEAGWFVLRDNTQSNVFLRDSITFHGPGQVQFFASCSGSYPGTCFNNNFDRCVIKNDGPNAYGHAFFWQDYAKWDTVTNCVFVSRDGGLGFTERLTGPVLIDHNTIVAQKPWLGATNLDIQPESVSGTLKFTNNIVYSWPTLGVDDNYVAMQAVESGVKGHLDAHHNLYFCRFGRDSSLWVGRYTRPGPGGYWCNSVGMDCVGSLYGDPLFVNSSSVLGFDAAVKSGSPAKGAGENGTDIGASPTASSTADITAPAAVGDLKLTLYGDRFATLQWTAPGDDGALGQAGAFDLRWSQTAITAGNFGSASQWMAVPAPVAAGATQQVVITGLTPGGTYYFAIKTRDEMVNWSPISNVVTVTTQTSDLTAPNPVNDLEASP